MAKQKVRADMIKAALAIRHKEDSFFTEVRNGPAVANELLILDAVAFKRSWANPCITGYEIKVSRSDFLADEKWRGYLKYCNQFYFVCPGAIIQQDELPKEVGLIYYNHDKRSLYTVRKAQYQEIEPPVDMMMYLIMRWDNQEHPYFNSTTEYFRALMEGKAELRKLGRGVSYYLQKRISDLQLEIAALKSEAGYYDDGRNLLEEVRKLLFNYTGRIIYKESLIKELNLLLQSKEYPPALVKNIQAIDEHMQNIKALMIQNVLDDSTGRVLNECNKSRLAATQV